MSSDGIEREKVPKAFYYRFLRSALPEDNQPPGSTYWVDEFDAEEPRYLWLTPQQVMGAGLTAALRVGLQLEAAEGGPEVVAQTLALQAGAADADNGPVAAADPPAQQPGKIQGGYTEDWRWEFIPTDEGVKVALDNRPLVQRKAEENRPHPNPYNVIVPLDVLEAVVQMARP